ncbi:MAG: hypothetical protein ACTS5I_01735, partial [Rhodanobacter sp.]
TGARALPDNPFTYVSSKAPKSHVDFQNYAHTTGDQIGLCSVVGLGDEFDADAYGNAVRSNFSAIEDALTKSMVSRQQLRKTLRQDQFGVSPSAG